MASLIDLRASVAKATPVEDHSTFQYHVQLKYGSTSWEVTKRFSDFDKLLQNLASNKYAGLPKMPGKTLLGAPTDQAAIEARKGQLQSIPGFWHNVTRKLIEQIALVKKQSSN